MFQSAFAILSAAVLALAKVPAVFSPQPQGAVAPSAEDWDRAEDRATRLVTQLNLTEKVSIVTGDLVEGGSSGCLGWIRPIERVGFSGLCSLDGPNAVNRANLVSVFPSGMTAAASWDRDLLYRRGVAIGEEFKGKGANIMLGPSTGPLGRHPLGGRNWEAFSADPYLAGEAIKYTVLGAQSVGLQTTSKHFIGNEQETQRTSTILANGTVIEGISSNIDDRTLHELYLWPFADALRAGTTSVMCSYNRLNSTYACEQPRALTEILRKELGFRGSIVSDWFATHSTSKAANAGLDMEQPGLLPEDAAEVYGESYFGPKLEAAVRARNVTEERVDNMVRNVLTPYFLLGQDSPDYPTPAEDLPFVLAVSNTGWNYPLLDQMGTPVAGRDVRGSHHELIRKIGASATVLLKNEDGQLPLSSARNASGGGISNIGVFGNAAITPVQGLAYEDYGSPYGSEYGVLTIGGGSGSARNSYIVSPLDAIKDRAGESGATVQHITTNELLASNDFRNVYPIPDVCLVFLKAWAAESYDRLSFESDWNSTLAVNNVANLCGANKTVVVTNSAGVNTMPWADNVTAIVATHFPGQEVGNSIVDVLWGQTEPSGRLPYTIPKTGADYGFPVLNLTNADGTPVSDSSKWQANFTEGTLVDYRHFDANEIEPLYEFGFGLGYTTFELDGKIELEKLSNGTIAELPDADAQIAPGGNVDLWSELIRVSTQVKNSGDRTGSAVVQLYLTLPDQGSSYHEPARVLRGFQKIEMDAGATAGVEMLLKRRDLSYWDVTAQQWRIPRGVFKVSVGFSSRDLPLEAEVDVLGWK